MNELGRMAIGMTLLVFFLIFIPRINYAEIPVQEGLVGTQIENNFSSTKNPPLYIENENQKNITKKSQEYKTALSKLNLKIENTKKELSSEKEKINQLTQNEQQLNEKLIKQKLLLKKQIALTYRIQDESLLKTLLSQKNINDQEKSTVYANHLNQAQLNLAQKISQNLTQLEKTKQELQLHVASLEKIQQTQQSEHSRLIKLI